MKTCLRSRGDVCRLSLSSSVDCERRGFLNQCQQLFHLIRWFRRAACDEGRPSTLSPLTWTQLSLTTIFLLADNILIYGVGCREAKDKRSDCYHDNTKDD